MPTFEPLTTTRPSMADLAATHVQITGSEGFQKTLTARMRLCISHPPMMHDPQNIVYGKWVFDHHQEKVTHMRWNACFCIAVMCNLSLFDKQCAAWGLISNSTRGQVELTTSDGYSLMKVFEYLGIEIDTALDLEQIKELNYRLSKRVVDQLIEIFQLPVGNIHTLTPPQRNRRTLLVEKTDLCL